MTTTSYIKYEQETVSPTGSSATHTCNVTPTGKESDGYVLLLTVEWTTSNNRTISSVTSSNITWTAATPRFTSASLSGTTVYTQIFMGVVGPGWTSGTVSTAITHNGTTSGSNMYVYTQEFRTDHPSPDWTVSQQGSGATGSSGTSVQTPAMTGANENDVFIGNVVECQRDFSGSIINQQAWITYDVAEWLWYGDVPSSIGGSIPATGLTGASSGYWLVMSALLSPGAAIPTIEPGRYHQSAAA